MYCRIVRFSTLIDCTVTSGKIITFVNDNHKTWSDEQYEYITLFWIILWVTSMVDSMLSHIALDRIKENTVCIVDSLWKCLMVPDDVNSLIFSNGSLCLTNYFIEFLSIKKDTKV